VGGCLSTARRPFPSGSNKTSNKINLKVCRKISSKILMCCEDTKYLFLIWEIYIDLNLTLLQEQAHVNIFYWKKFSFFKFSSDYFQKLHRLLYWL
jgi:hypothetical protein